MSVFTDYQGSSNQITMIMVLVKWRIVASACINVKKIASSFIICMKENRSWYIENSMHIPQDIKIELSYNPMLAIYVLKYIMTLKRYIHIYIYFSVFFCRARLDKQPIFLKNWRVNKEHMKY